MILTVPLQVGTLLANVRYKWLANGIVGSVLSTGITQPDPAYPTFRFDVIPPLGAEELTVFDATDVGNWNVASYLTALIGQNIATSAPLLSTDLSRLKIVCAAMLRRSPDEFTISGVDLFLMAVNNARRQAELMHDFEYSRVVASVNLTAAGAALSDVTVLEGVATNGIKSIVGVRSSGVNGYSYPLEFTRSDIAYELDRNELALDDDYYTRRYPSDADVLDYGTNSGIVQRGGKLFLHPGFSSSDPTSVTLFLDGYGWLPNYGSTTPVTTPEDFIVQYGFSYLQWATICELNKIFQTFVPRQEGNLTSPEQERAEAWRQLVLWDSYLVDPSVTQ